MIKKTLIYLAGNFSSKIFSVIIIPIYALYVTASELGTYDFQLTIANFLQPILVLAIWESILRYGLNSNTDKLKTVISTSVSIMIGTIGVSSIVLSLVYFKLYSVDFQTLLYLILILQYPVVTVFGYMVRAIENVKTYALSGVISAFINMLMIILFVILLKMGLLGLLLSAIISNFINIVFLFFGSKLYNYISFKDVSKAESIILLSYSIPLIFNLVFGWFTSSFARIYINTIIGEKENGMYAFASKFSTIILQIASIVNMTMIEDALKSINSNQWKGRYENNLKEVMKLFFIISYLFLPVIGIYYKTISNLDFQKSLILVPFLIYFSILTNLSTLLGNVFQTFNKTKVIFFTTLISGIVNVVFVSVFGLFWNLTGVVIAQIISGIVLVVCRYLLGKKIINYKFNFVGFLLYSLIFFIISVLIVIRNVSIDITCFFIILATAIYIYRGFIERVIGKYILRKKNED